MAQNEENENKVIEEIINRKFKMKFRLQDIVWYLYGLVFGVLNLIWFISFIHDGNVIGAIISGVVVVLVVSSSILAPYFDSQAAFWRKKGQDLSNAVLDEYWATIEKLYAENQKLQANQKPAKKAPVKKTVAKPLAKSVSTRKVVAKKGK